MSRVKCNYDLKCPTCKYRIKCALLDRDLVVYERKISKNRQDSFWYDGVIAKIGNCELRAVGEIKASYKGRLYYGDDAKRFAISKRWSDKDLKYFEFDNNNWFELFDSDDGYVSDGDYDGALDDLVDLYFDKEVKGE